jgi:hypothetical protein
MLMYTQTLTSHQIPFFFTTIDEACKETSQEVHFLLSWQGVSYQVLMGAQLNPSFQREARSAHSLLIESAYRCLSPKKRLKAAQRTLHADHYETRDHGAELELD